MTSSVSESSYFPTGVYRKAKEYSFKGRKVVKFIRENNESKTIIEAARAIQRIIESFNLCPTFPSKTNEEIESEIKDKHYLIINGRAICVSVSLQAPGDASLDYQDIYFSGCLFREPVECTQGHVLEKQYAEFWGKANNFCCPVSDDHKLGELVINELLQDNIQAYLNEKTSLNQKFENMEQNQTIQEIIKLKKDCALEVLKKETTEKNVSTLVKVIIKGIGTQIPRMIRTGGKAIAVATAMSLVFGILSCVRRMRQARTFADYIKAAGEVVSGSFCLVPVVGFAASFCVDVLIGLHDNKSLQNFSIDIKELALKSSELHKMLGLPDDLNKKDEKEQMKIFYQHFVLIFHPDKSDQWKGLMNEEDAKELMQSANMAKEYIGNYIRDNLTNLA